jgi:hypothetical protein
MEPPTRNNWVIGSPSKSSSLHERIQLLSEIEAPMGARLLSETDAEALIPQGELYDTFKMYRFRSCFATPLMHWGPVKIIAFLPE